MARTTKKDKNANVAKKARLITLAKTAETAIFGKVPKRPK